MIAILVVTSMLMFCILLLNVLYKLYRNEEKRKRVEELRNKREKYYKLYFESQNRKEIR